MTRSLKTTANSGDSPRVRTVKGKADTIEGAAERLRTLKDVAVSPIPLTKKEQAIFQDIMKSRDVDFWSPNDKRLAALLAKSYQRLAGLEEELMETPEYYEDDKGNFHPHPLVMSVQRVHAIIKGLVNSLGMSASTKGLTAPNQKKRNAAGVKTRELMEQLEGETDLI